MSGMTPEMGMDNTGLGLQVYLLRDKIRMTTLCLSCSYLRRLNWTEGSLVVKAVADHAKCRSSIPLMVQHVTPFTSFPSRILLEYC